MDIPSLVSALGGFAFVAGSVEEFWKEPRRSSIGAEGLVGRTARVLPPERQGDEPGWVVVDGERWRASAPFPLTPGSSVRIDEVQGLELSVVEADSRRRESARRSGPHWQWTPGLALWGVATVSAALSGGSMEGALVAGPMVVLVCYAAIAALAFGAD